jgi:hypothetical protein
VPLRKQVEYAAASNNGQAKVFVQSVEEEFEQMMKDISEISSAAYNRLPVQPICKDDSTLYILVDRFIEAQQGFRSTSKDIQVC